MKQADKWVIFCERILLWFARHKRTLPWRNLAIDDDTQRAYTILVSEVMLQQTQVPRVIVIFKRFLDQFPTIRDLAKASNRDVIIAWRGMGYNSRALRLRDAAKSIVEREGRKGRKGRNGTPLRPLRADYAGQGKGRVVFPREYEELIAIKGIGPYTAAAIRNFAFNLPTPCIDTNIRRILHRVFVGPDNADGTFETNDRMLMPIAQSVLRIALETRNQKPETKNHSTADYHAALMDFGSSVCTKRVPKCEICPMKGMCKSAFRVKSHIPKPKSPTFAPAGATAGRQPKSEPGRLVGSTFIPNRIFRGKIIEALRDHHAGLSLEAIGKMICIDWQTEDLRPWLEGLIIKLAGDGLIESKSGKWFLAS